MQQPGAPSAPAGVVNRRLILLIGILLGAFIGAARSVGQAVPVAGASAAGASVAFRGVTVVDVTTGRLLADQTVVVAGTRIRAVGPEARVRAPRGAQVVEAKGKYLIPGLWDMHFHSYGLPPQPFYSLLIANGVTGIRDPAQFIPIDTLSMWRREIAAGTRVGPRQLVTGSMLESSTRFDGFDAQGRSTGRFDSTRFEGARLVTIKAQTPKEARRLIDSLHEAGAEFIKTHFDGLSRETFFAMAAEARRVGVRLEGHLPYQVTMVEGSDSGMRIFDHLAQLMGAFGPSQLASTCQGDSASLQKCTALAARLRRNGTWVEIGPTLQNDVVVRSYLPYLPDSLRHTLAQKDTAWRPRWCQVVDLVARSDMPLLSGTDVYIGPGGLPPSLIHEELAFVVSCGMTPLQALQTVTINPARYLRGTDSLGTIAPGKLADLVLLDANPLEDITNTTKISAVVANGRYFDRAALNALLADVARAADEFERARKTQAP